MIKIGITKAGAIGNQLIWDAEITISGEPPRHDKLPYPENIQESNKWFQAQAESLGNLLIKTLPGGTLDRLICFLLRSKASHFIVSYQPDEKEKS